MDPPNWPSSSGENIPRNIVTRTAIPQHEDTFSRANVFALFVTVTVCLLLQPYGSLLYPKPRTVFGRMFFFLWRLNPIACLLEVVLLVVAFSHGIQRAISRRSHSGIPRAFWSNVRMEMTAIQLLRDHGRIPDHWTAFAASQHDTGDDGILNDTSQPYHDSHPIRIDSPEGNTHLFDEISQSNEERLSDPSGSYPDDQSLASVDLGNPQAADTRANFDDVTIHQISRDVETGGLDASFSDISSTTGPSRIIGSIVGRHASERAAMVLNLLSFLGTVLVVIKLASIVVPTHIRLSVAFMIASWTSVQIVYLLSNRHWYSLADAAYLIRRTEELDSWLRLYTTVLAALSFPLLGGLSVLSLVTMHRASVFPPEAAVRFNDTFINIFTFQRPYWPFRAATPTTFPVGFYYFYYAGLFFIGEIPVLVCEIRIYWFMIKSLWGNRSTIFKLPPRTSHPGQSFCWRQYLHANFWSLYAWLITFSYLLSGPSFVFCLSSLAHKPTHCCFLPFYVILTTLWASLFLPSRVFMGKGYVRDTSDWVISLSLYQNIALTCMAFAAALLVHDEDKTSKPEWLEWIPRLKGLVRF